MRYSSGQHNINKSYNMGIHTGINNILFLIIQFSSDISKDKNYMTKEDWNHFTDKYSNIQNIMKQFNITKNEIECVGYDKLEDLIIERISLVDYIL